MSFSKDDLVAAPGLFSTYRQGENRVTATLLALLHYLPLAISNGIVSGLFEDNDYTLIAMMNQSGGSDRESIPDAEIRLGGDLLIEVKTSTNRVRKEQLNKHLQAVSDTGRLLYLTPDTEQPIELKKGNAFWAGFSKLDDILDNLVSTSHPLLGDREVFLIQNFRQMLEDDGLLARPHDTCVVAASKAWAVFKKYKLYVCQPMRSFRKVQYFGFYAEGEIKDKLACVDWNSVYPRILFSKEKGQFHTLNEGLTGSLSPEHKERLDKYVKDHRSSSIERFDNMVIFFDEGEDEIKTLNGPVKNDLCNEAGRTVAFTQGQRYCDFEDLAKANRTSDLLKP